VIYGQNNDLDHGIALSPDGKTVYYTVTQQTSDDITGYYAGSATTVMTFDTSTGLHRTPVVVDGYLQDITAVGDRLVVRTGEITKHVQNPVPYSTQIAVIDTETGEVLGEPVEVRGNPSENGGPSPLTIRGDRAYVVGQRKNGDGTYTTDVAIINLRDGEVLDGVQSFDEEGAPVSRQLDIKTDGRAYLTVVTQDLVSGDAHTTLYEFDSATGDVLSQWDPVPGQATPIYDQDGSAQYLASTTADGLTFYPVADPGSAFIGIPPASYVVTPDGNTAWIVLEGGPSQTVLVQFDLVNQSPPSGPPIFIDGMPTGNAVIDDDGDVFVTTTLEDGSTRITRIPGEAPSGFRMMTLDAGPSAPSNINVTYPEPEDTNPLLPEQFSSNGGDPAKFDVNSLLPI
jgi:hypothetical protein